MTRGSVTFSTRRMPMTSIASAIGSTSQNMNRHDRYVRMRPEIVGPMAGATEITIEMLPMNRPRSAGATSVMSVVMSSGIMIAVPLACTTRASRRISKPGASAAMQRAGGEEAHRGDEDRPRREPLQQEAGDRDHDRHREHERGGQPLRRRRW